MIEGSEICSAHASMVVLLMYDINISLRYDSAGLYAGGIDLD